MAYSRALRLAANHRPRTVDLRGRAISLIETQRSHSGPNQSYAESIASESRNRNEIARYLLHGGDETGSAAALWHVFSSSFRKLVIDSPIKRSSCQMLPNAAPLLEEELHPGVSALLAID